MVKRIILIVAIAMIAFSGMAMAGDTANVSVTANIVGTCKFGTGGGLHGGNIATLAFGELDPLSTSDVSATTTYQYWCTRGTVAATTADNGSNFSGSRRMAGGSPAWFIPYSFILSGHTQTGAGPSNPLTATITGSIANADYINASAGSYTDTVLLTITP
jgi:spore coat protein U-like protein